MGNTVGSLTKEQKSIIIGSILGDGYLRIVPKRKNAFLEINHSISQKDYVDWKYSKLGDLINNPPKERKGVGNRIAYRFFAKQHSELTELYLRFYSNGNKIIPNLELNPLMIAVWFMDDGSKSHKTYYINTQGFDYLSQKKLIKLLEKQYKIKSTLNKDKNYYRIRIKQDDTERFKELIIDYIIPGMRYKL